MVAWQTHILFGQQDGELLQEGVHNETQLVLGPLSHILTADILEIDLVLPLSRLKSSLLKLGVRL
jgi:hypothetical protein